MSNKYFNPGCALSIYKPQTEEKILSFLNNHYGDVQMHKICCRHDPQLESGSTIINVCAGCDKRFGTLYEGISTISLWEVIDSLDSFDFPDYNGLSVSILDACPVRNRPAVHKAVRSLLTKMNITIVESKYHGKKSRCCGDSLYPSQPLEKIHNAMKKRADEMPESDVVVYCVSCVKSIHIGGKKPRHLIDLLLNESTEVGEYDTVKWHKLLDEYIKVH